MTKEPKLMNKVDKLKLIGLCIKAISGVIGGSLILTEHRPYLTLTILAIGAAANEIVTFIKDKEHAKTETTEN